MSHLLGMRIKRGRWSARRRLATTSLVAGLFAFGLIPLGLSGCWDTSAGDRFYPSPTIDSVGRMTQEELGIDGFWYGFADGLGPRPTCSYVGKHNTEACSKLIFPEVFAGDDLSQAESKFYNDGGKMCAWGRVARLLPCCTEDEVSDPSSVAQCEPQSECHPEDAGCGLGINTLNCSDDPLDYSSMWGAGIGFSFRTQASDESEGSSSANPLGLWSAREHHVAGLSFHLEWHGEEQDNIPMRVQVGFRSFEDATLAEDKGTLRQDGKWIEPGGVLEAPWAPGEHPNGHPFYREEVDPGGTWPNSPLHEGYNEVSFSQVYPPPAVEAVYADPSAPISDEILDALLEVSFHVPVDNTGRFARPFSFCISDIRFLKAK